MPNYSNNRFAFVGKKQDVINFLNKGIKDESLKLNTDDTYASSASKLEKAQLRLSSFYPMPDTYHEYDTTNDMHTLNRWIMDNLFGTDEDFMGGTKAVKKFYGVRKKDLTAYNTYEKRSEFARLIENELENGDGTYKLGNGVIRKKDYDKYVKGYEDAVKYQQETYGCVGWYDWRVKYYGTKWDTSLDFVCTNGSDEKLPDIACFEFECETAWSVPMAWLLKMQNENEEISIIMGAWEESGAYFTVIDIKEDDILFDKELSDDYDEDAYDEEMNGEDNYEDEEDEFSRLINEMYINYGQAVNDCVSTYQA